MPDPFVRLTLFLNDSILLSSHFVHRLLVLLQRNIANQFHENDDSAQAALAFAVQEAGVQHGMYPHPSAPPPPIKDEK